MSEVVGVGIDLIEIDRVAAVLARQPRFAERCFTDAERAYCMSRKFPPQHFAARFAAKEAVGKATGNEELQAEGQRDQAAGNTKQAGEKVKDIFK